MEQFFEHSDLGLGALTFQKGPGTIHCWTGRIADTEILFSIILNTSELRSANLDFIRSVLQNWREYLSKAEHEIQAQIGKSPEKFGLQRAPFPETEIPAEQPQFLFYDETEWGLHFEICTLPVGEPFGLTHIFRKRTQNEQKNYYCIQRTTQEPSALRICSKKAFVVQIPLFCKRLGGSFTRMNSCHVWRPVGALMKKEH